MNILILNKNPKTLIKNRTIKLYEFYINKRKALKLQ